MLFAAATLNQVASATADPYFVTSVAFSPDGTKIVSGGGSGTIKVWDATSLNMITSTDTGCGSGISSVDFSPDGTKIVSGDGCGTIKVWDATSLSMITQVESVCQYGISSVEFSPDGTKIVSGDVTCGTIKVWDGMQPLQT